MQRPAAAIPIVLSLALSSAAAFVALSAPDPMPAGVSEALRVSADRDLVPISWIRMVIAALPMGALAGRLIAWGQSWR